MEEFTESINGKYFTLDLPIKISTSSRQQFFFLLYDDFEYYMLLHDPDFFIGFYNPNFPNLRIITKPIAGGSYFYNIILTEKVELDTLGDPCNPDPEYSFQVNA